MPRAVSLLISALGGEGGGVLASWITNAAVHAGLPVQRTSIPGVAQRTGATTYYLEIFPQPWRDLQGCIPVLGLHPAEGAVDVVVATELLEASRALRRGFVTPERTLLISSTHRVYTIAEKATQVDGRFDERTARAAIASGAKRAILYDCRQTARRAGSHVNAVMLGALAAADCLPIPAGSFREAMRREGKAIEENLRGFEAGLLAAGTAATRGASQEAAPRPSVASRGGAHRFPPGFEVMPDEVSQIVEEGVRRLCDYQNKGYAQMYLQRLTPLASADRPPFRVVAAAARYLALWMSCEDVIRVAQLKSRPSRLQRIRESSGAGTSPFAIVDYLKPGVAELASLLPRRLALALLWLARRRGWNDGIPMQVRSTSIHGYLQLRLLASLRPWRPLTFGYQQEQQRIDAWLERIGCAATVDRDFAAEVAECGKLVRGYSGTRERGLRKLERLYAALIDPVLRGELSTHDAAQRLRRARAAAFADEGGEQLESELRGAAVAVGAAEAGPAQS